jgi:predicted Zn-dependent protease
MRSVIISVCLLFCSAHTALLAAAPSKDRIDFYYGIAEGNFLVGDLNGAERGIEQILRIDPDHVPALTLKTRIMLDRGKAATALEAAERAMEART